MNVIISKQQLSKLMSTINTIDIPSTPIIKENMESKMSKITHAIDNNEVILMIYSYDHRDDKDKNKRYAKVIRPFVTGRSAGKSNKMMIRAYEYGDFTIASTDFEQANEDKTLRYKASEEYLKGKDYDSKTTTWNPKWKTYFLSQITYWEVIATDEIDIPKEFQPSYVKNDKLFSSIIKQK